MKKLFFAAVLSMTAFTASAAHGPSGCGLGAVIFKDSKGTMMNVLAATTNGSSGNQTFGMSTGTLGCEDAAKAKVAAVSFIENNMVALSTDVARGHGENLDAYLSLIGVRNADKVALKKNYSSIFTTDATARTVHTKISSIVRM